MTTKETVSSHLPTPADLRALPDHPYSAAESKTAAILFAEIHANGTRTDAQLAKSFRKRKQTAFKNGLQAADERGHVAFKVVNRERVWSLTPALYSIPVALVKKKNTSPPRRKPRGTPFQKFYREKFRPEFAKRYCADYLRRMDKHAAEIYVLHKSLCVDEMNAEWFEKLMQQMKTDGVPEKSRKVRLLDLTRIVREKFPYRRLAVKPTWKLLEPIILAEGDGFFGEYYARVYDQKAKSGRGTYRAAVLRFLCWLERPIKLTDIDGELLDRFHKYVVDLPSVKTRKAANNCCAFIRQIVNDWRPGTLHSLRQRPLPRRNEGTVQHYWASRYLPNLRTTKKNKCQIVMAETVLRDLDQFVGKKDLYWDEFTDELADDFLRWRRGFGRQRQQTMPSTLHVMRAVIMAVSKAAKGDGITRFRLHPKPIPDYAAKRNLNPTASGYAKHQSKRPPVPTERKKPGRKEIYTEWNKWLPKFLADNPTATGSDARKCFIGKAPSPGVARVQVGRLRKTK